MKLPVKQTILTLTLVAAGVGLFFASRSDSPKSADKVTTPSATSTAYSFEHELEHAKETIAADALQHIKALEQTLEAAKGDAKNAILDSIGKSYDKLNQPAIAAHYFEEIANVANTEKAWLNAAYRYFDAFRVKGNDSIAKPALVEKALLCYAKVLELNPKNLDAKTDMGVCYTETAQPMKGIMLLREVIAEKPNHENAQMNLGILSVKSKQYDRATVRFEEVLKINPKRLEALLFLGESYVELGQKEKAINCFERYKRQSTDAAAIKDVSGYIDQLKKN